MGYLQPPHIQLGFYWHLQPCEACYARVEEWLGGLGFVPLPYAIAVRGRDGRLPAFPQLICSGLPRDDIREFATWPPDESSENGEWFPVLRELKLDRKGGLRVQLGYAFMSEPGVRRHANRVVEIVLSGADWNLLDNTTRQSPPKNIVRRAAHTERYTKRIFRGVCSDLRPSYAAFLWEEGLEPPEVLQEDGWSRPVGGSVYFDQSIVDAATLEAEARSDGRIRIEPAGAGTFVELPSYAAATERTMAAAVRMIRRNLLGCH